MVVLICSKVKSQTVEGSNGVLHAVSDLLLLGDGVIVHFADSADAEWNVYEV